MIVVKIGGSAGINYSFVAKDIAKLHKAGRKLILVHGGSSETNEVAAALGHPAQFLTHASGMTSRITDRRTLEIFQMVYCGLINKRLVELLQIEAVNAVGLSGMDGRIFEGKRKEAVKYVENGKTKIHRGDFTGSVEKINTGLLNMLLDAGYLPVLTPPAISTEGIGINTDGDTAAAMLAEALKAEALLLLSNIPGLLANFPDEASLIPSIPISQVNDPKYMSVAQGRMKKKVLGAVQAVESGVGRVVFGDARIENPVTEALDGRGTVIG